MEAPWVPAAPLPAEPLCVNVHQAKTHLSKLLQDVETGHEVVIARAGVPIARLVPWRERRQGVSPPGAMAGRITVHDSFDDPLDDLFAGLSAEEEEPSFHEGRVPRD